MTPRRVSACDERKEEWKAKDGNAAIPVSSARIVIAGRVVRGRRRVASIIALKVFLCGCLSRGQDSNSAAAFWGLFARPTPTDGRRAHPARTPGSAARMVPDRGVRAEGAQRRLLFPCVRRIRFEKGRSSREPSVRNGVCSLACFISLRQAHKPHNPTGSLLPPQRNVGNVFVPCLETSYARARVIAVRMTAVGM